jgi:hypothetical protein
MPASPRSNTDPIDGSGTAPPPRRSPKRAGISAGGIAPRIRSFWDAQNARPTGHPLDAQRRVPDPWTAVRGARDRLILLGIERTGVGPRGQCEGARSDRFRLAGHRCLCLWRVTGRPGPLRSPANVDQCDRLQPRARAGEIRGGVRTAEGGGAVMRDRVVATGPRRPSVTTGAAAAVMSLAVMSPGGASPSGAHRWRPVLIRGQELVGCGWLPTPCPIR